MQRYIFISDPLPPDTSRAVDRWLARQLSVADVLVVIVDACVNIPTGVHADEADAVVELAGTWSRLHGREQVARIPAGDWVLDTRSRIHVRPLARARLERRIEDRGAPRAVAVAEAMIDAAACLSRRGDTRTAANLLDAVARQRSLPDRLRCWAFGCLWFHASVLRRGAWRLEWIMWLEGNISECATRDDCPRHWLATRILSPYPTGPRGSLAPLRYRQEISFCVYERE